MAKTATVEISVKELLTKLVESGTGAAKVRAAHARLREVGVTHVDADAAELVKEMELLKLWPEGTIAKAHRILKGLDPAPKTKPEPESALDDLLSDAPEESADEPAVQTKRGPGRPPKAKTEHVPMPPPLPGEEV